MAHYVILANFTEKGVGAIKDTGKRAKAFRDLAKQMGATVKDVFWTFGHYDVVITLEAAKDESVASLMMKVGSLGNMTSQTLRAFTEKEIDAITSPI